MEESLKQLSGTTIEIREGSITFTREDKTYAWWRERLDRDKDGILCPEIGQHMLNIAQSFTRKNDKGQIVSKYNMFMTNLSPNPRSSQGLKKQKYKKYLINHLNKNKEALLKFKDKEVLVYIAVYLRPKKAETQDIDNFSKVILDALKEFIGDDSKVNTLIMKKYKLENYPKEDLSFLEQVVILVTDPKASSTLSEVI
ncbi:MAG: RusA family crossover junction endodeoxyribonuclease [Candidatus Nanoarchaeia archaeon]|nr:RusA family crossover junction endodeoxyribonuclease [Candidatus Nanoarchaeia archaeon]